MPLLLILCAALTGVASALQSGSNGALARSLGNPAWAMLVVAGVSFACAFLVVLGFAAAGAGRGAFSAAASVPWWAWIGGVFGAVFLLATILVAPRLGAAVFVAVTVTSSVLTSLALDHWGLMQFPAHPAGLGRAAGAALMVAGVALIAAF